MLPAKRPRPPHRKPKTNRRDKLLQKTVSAGALLNSAFHQAADVAERYAEAWRQDSASWRADTAQDIADAIRALAKYKG